jgi:tRNA-dihydrouridine synthase
MKMVAVILKEKEDEGKIDISVSNLSREDNTEVEDRYSEYIENLLVANMQELEPLSTDLIGDKYKKIKIDAFKTALKRLTVAEILKEIGADGLVHPDLNCGCSIKDICPCGYGAGDCKPARLEIEDGEYNYYEYEQA